MGEVPATRMPCICTYAMRLFPKPCCHVRCPCVLPLACRCRSPTAHRLPAFHQPPTRPSQTNFSASNPAPPQNNSLAMSQTTSIGITHVLTSHQSSPATKPSPRPATPSTNRPRRQNTPPCPAHKTPPLQNHPATNQPRCAIIDILQASDEPPSGHKIISGQYTGRSQNNPAGQAQFMYRHIHKAGHGLSDTR